MDGTLTIPLWVVWTVLALALVGASALLSGGAWLVWKGWQRL